MEDFRRIVRALGLLIVLLAAALPTSMGVKWTVGGNMGWQSGVNFTIWAQDKDFYNGDWLFFVYDRHILNVLEVNKTDYDMCRSDHFLKNWTRGAGRDVVPLNETRSFYLISGNGFCFSGVKLAVDVKNPPPPPTAAPHKNIAPPSFLISHWVLVIVLAATALWDVIPSVV